MADSAITKKALASSLKKLICERPFSKISISDICDMCTMNRKSFYYHFRDKYDLVNYIFDFEFSEYSKNITNERNTLHQLCSYLYANRDYYRRAFKIEGQNCFRSHFHEFAEEYIKNTYIPDRPKTAALNMRMQFLTDGLVCAVERWILDSECTSPDRFFSLLSAVLDNIGVQ